MSIIAIDIGTTLTKIIEYNKEQILNKEIIANKNVEKILNDFLDKNNISTKDIDKIVLTGIGADKLILNNYNIPIEYVEELRAIARAGQYFSKKEEVLIASVGTGTALVRAKKNEIKHLGGTGIGAGTLINLCEKLANTCSIDEIIELSKKGDLGKIDIKIGDVTDKKITTLPLDLTLSNFGKLNEKSQREDIVLGIINMVFEVIGMMVVFCLKNDKIKEVVLIGSIVTIPRVKQILEKIEKIHDISFIIPENPEFGVAIGAIKNIEKEGM